MERTKRGEDCRELRIEIKETDEMQENLEKRLIRLKARLRNLLAKKL